jgi:hypothetical protein
MCVDMKRNLVEGRGRLRDSLSRVFTLHRKVDRY